MTAMLMTGAIAILTEEGDPATDLLLRDGRIEVVGGAARAAAGDARRVDLSGCVVTPGLVNAHHHLLQSAFRTLPGTRGVPMREWLPTMSAAYARVGIDAELAGAAAAVGVAEGLQRAGSGLDGEPDELGFGIHAGWSETAVIMHLAPELVDEDAFSRSVPDPLAGIELIGFNGTPVTFGWLSDDFDPSGVIGDPTGATPAAGAQLFDAGVDFAVRALHEIDRFPLRSR